MKKNSIFAFVIYMFSLSTLYGFDTRQLYNIEFLSSSKEIKAHVKSRITMSSDTLFVGEYGAWHEKEGWASYISDIKARNENNEVFELKKINRLMWLVKGNTINGELYLEYTVSFPYSIPEVEWSAGPRSTAAFYD